ncbi:MAG TPA: hypothetical protein VEL79_02435 [Vicinamibacterales bacterium]|nr:hypothetical protein [Vicinamibacterales bacterium]
MRTTLDIDDDVLQAAKEIAANRRSTIGKVISELVRKGLRPKPWVRVRNGVPLLGPRNPSDPILTVEFINKLRDEEP